jgi:hypothetical protein
MSTECEERKASPASQLEIGTSRAYHRFMKYKQQQDIARIKFHDCAF